MILNSYIDHTLLKPESTEKEVDKVVKEAIDNNFFSVMINPYWVPRVKNELKSTNVKAACVVGFPLGSNKTAVKVFETEQAIQDGADEVDMVMNIGEFKSGNYDKVADDIKAVVDAAHKNNIIVKVIIETALLTDQEIETAAKIVRDSRADFVKTSTGFSTRGANVHDIEIIKAAVGDTIKIKAAGGIHTAKMAEEMIAAGASRLGVSASLKLIGK